MNYGLSLLLDEIVWVDNYVWVLDVVYKNGKYYLVFFVGIGYKDRKNFEKSIKWMGIGVVESDFFIGFFKDMIGVFLWCEFYVNDFSLFIDDDGKVYLYVYV